MKKIIIYCAVLFTAGLSAWLLYKPATPAAGQKAAMQHEKVASEPYNSGLAWEMNMLKDPATGKIPVGIRQQEIDLKLQLRAEQAMNRTPEVNAHEFVGPGNKGGRTRSVVYDRLNDNIVLAGGVSGGVFRSVDGGASWARVSPMNEPADVTCIVQDPRSGNENIWYYSTGNAGRGNSASFDAATGDEVAYYLGSGVYLSVDNGASWAKITGVNETGSLETFDKHLDLITRLAVHPVTGDIYAAASGAIYRGKFVINFQTGTFYWSWIKVLGNGVLSYSAMTDVVISNSGVIYAGISGLVTGGFDGVWKSSTGNTGAWTRIAGNSSPSGWMAEGTYGRVVLAIPPSNQNQLWVAFYNSHNKTSPTPNVKLFKYSYNMFTGFGSWVNKTSAVPSYFECYTGYALAIAVKPDNAAHIYLGGLDLVRIIDGTTPVVDQFYVPHSDIQWITFKPTLPNRPNNKDTMLLGCDGGIYRGYIPNSGGPSNWITMNNGYATIQYYYSSISQNAAATLQYAGGTQDNGTTSYSTTSNPYDHGNLSWGDGFQCYLDNNYSYTSSQWGEVNRILPNGGVVSMDPTAATWDAFRTYFHMNPQQPDLMFYADLNELYRTNSASTAWSGGGWTKLGGCSFYYPVGDFWAEDEITAMATTSSANATLFVGTMHGKVARLTNSETATNASVPTIMSTTTNMSAISWISVDPSDNNKVMFTVANYNSFSVYYSSNALAATPTWTVVEGNLTLPSFRSCAIVNGPNGKEYYVGTSVGLFRTTLLNGASTVWTQESAGLIGDAVITSLSYRPADYKLLIGTHGNGMYVATLGAGSKVIETAQTPKAAAIQLFPNPLRNGDAVTIRYTAPSEKTETLELFDAGGKSVVKEQVFSAAGENNITRVFDLAPGIYIVRLGQQTTRLVIQK